jgi:hypothetical protein
VLRESDPTLGPRRPLGRRVAGLRLDRGEREADSIELEQARSGSDESLEHGERRGSFDEVAERVDLKDERDDLGSEVRGPGNRGDDGRSHDPWALVHRKNVTDLQVSPVLLCDGLESGRAFLTRSEYAILGQPNRRAVEGRLPVPRPLQIPVGAEVAADGARAPARLGGQEAESHVQ